MNDYRSSSNSGAFEEPRMAMPRKNHRKRINIVTLKHVIEKLQGKFSLPGRKPCTRGEMDEDEEFSVSAAAVPKDVKEGHFVVLAICDGESKRFVVELDYLSHPAFVRLLEQAEEEFGFNQRGALVVPCRPIELECILAEQWKEKKRASRDGGVEYVSHMAESF